MPGNFFLNGRLILDSGWTLRNLAYQADWGVHYWDGTHQRLASLTPGTAGQFLVSGGDAAAPSWSTLDWSTLAGKPSTFDPSAHTHAWADLTDPPATYEPSAHSHAWADLTDPPATYEPSAHSHAVSDVTGLEDALAELAPLDGTGATGTWGIDISGNAATATSATTAGNLTGSPAVAASSITVPYAGGYYIHDTGYGLKYDGTGGDGYRDAARVFGWQGATVWAGSSNSMVAAFNSSGAELWNRLSIQMNATSGSIYGVYVNRGSGIGGAVANAYGFMLNTLDYAGSITNGYGFYCGQVYATNAWGFYQAGTNPNYLAGSLAAASYKVGSTEVISSGARVLTTAGGLPTGGSSGQVLTKSGSGDNDFGWSTPGTVSVGPLAAMINTSLIMDGTSRNVVITGYNFQSGCTVAISGTGISVGTVTFTNPSQLTVALTGTFGSSMSARTITVTNPDGAAGTSGAILTLAYPAPVVTGVSPTSWQTDSTQAITVTGTFFRDGATVGITGPTGGTLTITTTYNSSTQLSASVIASGATGSGNVIVTNPDYQTSSTGAGSAITITAALNTRGWVMGGTQGGSNRSTVWYLTYSSETGSTLANNCSAVRQYPVGTYSSDKGYSMGGYVQKTLIDKMPFSTEIPAANSNGLTGDRYIGYGIASSTKGYYNAGFIPAGAAQTTQIGMPFSTEVPANVSDALNSTKYNVQGIHSSTKGYAMSYGGVANVQVVTFSTETDAASSTASMGSTKYNVGAVTNGTDGYSAGGYGTGSGLNGIDKLVLSTETLSANSTTLSEAKWDPNGLTNRDSNGYFVGGYQGGDKTRVERLPFSTGTAANTGNTLSVASAGGAVM